MVVAPLMAWAVWSPIFQSPNVTAVRAPEVSLDVTVGVETGRLSVHYRVVNTSRSAIGLFNRLEQGGTSRDSQFPPDLVYVELDGETLHLLKMALPVPTGLQVTVRPLPMVSRVSREGCSRNG